MNRTVEIYSMLNDSEDESKCLKIFSGRLTKVDVNPVAKTVRLQASSYNPFDHIEVPLQYLMGPTLQTHLVDMPLQRPFGLAPL